MPRSFFFRYHSWNRQESFCVDVQNPHLRTHCAEYQKDSTTKFSIFVPLGHVVLLAFCEPQFGRRLEVGAASKERVLVETVVGA